MPDPHHYYLFAGYIVTWVIYGTYLVILARKAKRIRREMEKVKKVASGQ